MRLRPVKAGRARSRDDVTFESGSLEGVLRDAPHDSTLPFQGRESPSPSD